MQEPPPNAIYTDLAAWRALWPALGRIAGLDVGRKTIGLALSDARHQLAAAETTLHRIRFSTDAAALQQWLEKKQAIAIVMGLPLREDGEESPMSQSVRQFARNFQRWQREQGHPPLPLLLWDERWTSHEAALKLSEAGHRAARHPAKIDAAAAALILQSALDRL